MLSELEYWQMCHQLPECKFVWSVNAELVGEMDICVPGPTQYLRCVCGVSQAMIHGLILTLYYCPLHYTHIPSLPLDIS